MAKELVEKIFEKFEEHLNLSKNNRIIFSGKFGIGKSYFLNEFFNDEKYADEYFTIKVNPVNYSIATNQDIFELIKFDILFQILDKDIIDFENFNFPKGNIIYEYFSNKFLKDFISNADLLGEVIVNKQMPESYSVIKSLGKLISKITEIGKRDYENFKKEIENNPELQIIQEFFDKEEVKIGSFYENNAVTQLIYQLIKNIEEKTNKKTVLLIDDLDRIDPEHIFRILNIFSAHDRENENKFGIEKIILVCDLNNIESIYHHFYGDQADFFGYINKFYSLDPFYYSNDLYVNFFKANINSTIDNFDTIPYLEFIKQIISDAIEKNHITARLLFTRDYSISNIHQIFSSYEKFNIVVKYKGKRINYFHSYLKSYSTLKTIIYLFGDKKNFLNFSTFINRDIALKFNKIFAEFIAIEREYLNPKSNATYPGQFVIETNKYSEFEIQDIEVLESIDYKDLFSKILDIIDNTEVK